MQILLAALHLFALAVGLGAVWVRGRQMRTPLTEERLKALFSADLAWGIAAGLWLISGLWRLLGALEKPTAFYLHNPLFHLKITLFVLVFVLEAWPAMTLTKWRLRAKKGEPIDPAPLGRMRIINHVELGMVVVMVFAATAMARGYGQHAPKNESVACQVQESFQSTCRSCHSAAVRQGGLDLQTDPTAALLEVRSSQWPSEMRVRKGNPEGSLLYAKLTGQQGSHGTSMPQNGKASPEMIRLVESWIRDGAPACQP